MSSTRTVEQIFGEAAAEYDAWVHQALPTYDEIFAVALEAVPHPRDTSIAVADLGAGTGLFSERLAAAFPHAHITLYDATQEMLSRAQARFSREAERFRFIQQGLEVFSALREFDLVVSSLAIHHLEQADKRSLFGRIFDALRPGGAFVNVDQIRGEGPFGDLYWSTWLSRVRAAGAPESRIQASIARRRELDRDASLDEQLAWLRASGFAADCLYKHYFVAVFLALKAP